MKIQCMNKKCFCYMLLTLLILIIIYLFSAQSGQESQGLSDGFGAFLAGTVIGDLIEYMEVTFGFHIRKMAHVFIYFLLGITSSGMFWEGLAPKNRRWVKSLGSTVAFCFLAAAFDEYHQSFVPGRCGSVSDVFVDAAGFGAALVLFHLLVLCRQRRCAK